MTNIGAVFTVLGHRFLDMFRKKEDRGYDPYTPPPRNMIAICVGHSRTGDKGAVSVGGVSEWEFWQPIAFRVKEILQARGIASRVVDIYDGDGYGAAMSWVGRHLAEMGASHAIELHFNAASPSARGYEFLCYAGSEGGMVLAGDLHAAHKVSFPDATSRGVKTKKPGDRGALFLRRTPCPAVICEAFFGSNRDEWAHYLAHKEELAQAVALGLINTLK